MIFCWFDPMENHHLGIFFQAPKIRKSKFRSEGLEDVIFSDLNKYAPQWPYEKSGGKSWVFSWVVATSKRYSVEEVNCCRIKLQIIAVSWIDHVCGSGCFWMSLGYFVVSKNSLQSANETRGCESSLHLAVKGRAEIRLTCRWSAMLFS